jgi:hypothetical protein
MSMNTSVTLEAAILDSELQYINFFNGRLLSGEDLTADRDALRAQARYLGQAVGSGVATGLEVTSVAGSVDGTVQVQIKAGLAINHTGQTLILDSDQLLSLVAPTDPSAIADCVFSDCSRLPASSTLSTGGYYILTIAPASQREGLAPVSGLGNSPAPCNSRYFTEGVQFRLVPLPVSPAPDAAHARNLVAYQCFGVLDPAVQSFLKDPFSTGLSSYGLVDQADPQHLTPGDVPLAAVSFDALDGLQFIDMWSVRRRITRPAATRAWLPLLGDRRLAEGEAMFLQVQAQLESLRTTSVSPASIEARQYFRYLPPVGLVPLATSGFPQGFDLVHFFAGLTVRQPLFLEGRRLYHMIDIARDFTPIDTSNTELVWLYSIPENAMARDLGITPPQQAIVFTSGPVAFLGEARFDLSRWQYATFD